MRLGSPTRERCSEILAIDAHQSAPESPTKQANDVVDASLLHQVRAMTHYRFERHAQFASDLFTGMAFTNEPKNFEFTRRWIG